jgi:hypothetical protein
MDNRIRKIIKLNNKNEENVESNDIEHACIYNKKNLQKNINNFA